MTKDFEKDLGFSKISSFCYSIGSLGLFSLGMYNLQSQDYLSAAFCGVGGLAYGISSVLTYLGIKDTKKVFDMKKTLYNFHAETRRALLSPLKV